MKKHWNSFVVAVLLFVSVAVLLQCMDNDSAPDPRGTAFATEEKCRQCHQAIYDSALLSAHFHASAPASLQNVLGSFAAGRNIFVYDASTKLQMEQTDSGLYQALYINGKRTEARRFDMTFGLRHAQTSLYWKDDHLYELPVSYYTAVHAWATSPGFSAVVPEFTRMIGRDCFECHSSNISSKNKASAAADNYFSTAEAAETLEKNSLVYGIGCQRCHGSAAQHADWHREHPGEKNAKFIVVKNLLSHGQQLDMCAVCHSGNDKIKLKSRFAFQPGDRLADFFMSSAAFSNKKEFDVHGNQFNLLAQSKCFLQSKTINCSTCHNPHNSTDESMASYSEKCMACHQATSNNFCTAVGTPAISASSNCIDCHMPQQPSAAISFQLSGSSTTSSYLLRTHRIGIYKNGCNKKKF